MRRLGEIYGGTEPKTLLFTAPEPLGAQNQCSSQLQSHLALKNTVQACSKANMALKIAVQTCSEATVGAQNCCSSLLRSHSGAQNCCSSLLQGPSKPLKITAQGHCSQMLVSVTLCSGPLGPVLLWHRAWICTGSH